MVHFSYPNTCWSYFHSLDRFSLVAFHASYPCSVVTTTTSWIIVSVDSLAVIKSLLVQILHYSLTPSGTVRIYIWLLWNLSETRRIVDRARARSAQTFKSIITTYYCLKVSSQFYSPSCVRSICSSSPESSFSFFSFKFEPDLHPKFLLNFTSKDLFLLLRYVE